MSRMSGMSVETTWNPASVADGDMVSVDVTVPDAKLGDFAMASCAVDVIDAQITAAVTAANTVTVTLSNSTNGAVDLASHTLRVKVIPFDVI